MFSEEHLQSFWYKQALGLTGIKTVCGQSIHLINIGVFNHHQGPDFLQARIKIGDVEWVGDVELHIRTSDWLRHQHHEDANYQQVILHVVWINDSNSFTFSPILELSKFVKIQQLGNYDIIHANYHLHCFTQPNTLINISDYVFFSELGRKRMMDRKVMVLKMFKQAKLDFAFVLTRLVFRCFGRTTNADAFESLFLSIPIHLLRLYAFDQKMLEALLMGQANLLKDSFADDYAVKMNDLYLVLKTRHDLQPIRDQIKWLRMRPRNFPTIRIAQLSAFYHCHYALVQELIYIKELKDVDMLFEISLHSYWKNHFQFDECSSEQEKIIGSGFRQQIILHAFVPFLLAYGTLNEQAVIVERAMHWVSLLKPEQNTLVERFSSMGFKAKTIFETQALHELYLKYCLQKKCILCPRGSHLYTF